jgi:hypothetical protein
MNENVEETWRAETEEPPLQKVFLEVEWGLSGAVLEAQTEEGSVVVGT